MLVVDEALVFNILNIDLVRLFLEFFDLIGKCFVVEIDGGVIYV